MPWTPESLSDLATSYWKSCVLSAAVETGLFEALGMAGGTAGEVAGRAGTSEWHTGELLDALAALGLVEKVGDRYRIAGDAAPYLAPGGPACMLDALRYNIDLYAIWGRLGGTVRGGRPASEPTSHLGDDQGRTERFVMGMHSRALALAPAVLPALDVGPGRLLDVGGGPGTFSRLLAERVEGLRVTLFDLPAVLEIARGLIGTSEAADRFTFHGGDYRTDDLPGGFEMVLYCGALHQETPEGAAAVFGKLWRATEPGGTVWVVDMMLGENRVGPLFSNLFSLQMMLTSAGGRVFEEAAVRRGLEAAGFREAACIRPAGCPHWVVRAEKPEGELRESRGST